jgi:hypothetical protein
MMRRALWLAALFGAFPSGAAAQCGIDLIESGIRAYRQLDLEATQDMMRNAIDVMGRSASPCATEAARALSYLGAAFWLRELPDSAARAFEGAVIRAPRFRPDEFEFPPAIVESFEEARLRTPAVAVTVPDAVEIGPEGEDGLPVWLGASAGHWVTTTISAEGERVRVLYDGPIATTAEGIMLMWNGRDERGNVVPPGRYELEVVSADASSRPLRKVVIVLTVESGAPPPPPRDSVLLLAPAQAASGFPWGAVARAGAGLAAAGAAVGVPPAVRGFPDSEARFVVAGTLGVATIVGLVSSLRRGDAERPAAGPIASPTPDPAERAPAEPTVRVRTGFERRMELGEGSGVTRGSGGTPPWGR